MKKLRFSPDYFCSPIWHDDGETTGEFGDVNLNDLPISPELRSRIDDWSAWFDKDLNMSDPGNSKGMDDAEMRDFLATGRELFENLSKELGPKFLLRYGPFWENKN